MQLSDKKHDLTGRVFGRLTVIQRSYDDTDKITKQNNGRLWLCRCLCGKEVVVPAKELSRGHKLSCGCLKKEREEWFIKNLAGRITHNMSRNRLFRIWSGMIKRCEDESNHAYKNYGGRGISVCKEWHNLDLFVEWANHNGYKDGLSIDRIDNDGNYCPDNCKWSDNYEQANNKRNNLKLTYNGETLTFPEWARKTGIKAGTLRHRYKSGWSPEEIITTPVRVMHFGKTCKIDH